MRSLHKLFQENQVANIGSPISFDFDLPPLIQLDVLQLTRHTAKHYKKTLLSIVVGGDAPINGPSNIHLSRQLDTHQLLGVLDGALFDMLEFSAQSLLDG